MSRPRPTWEGPDELRDTGYGTVLVLSLSSLLVLVAMVVVALGAVAVSRHRAASAADLGALAAAGRAASGEAGACSAARRTVQAAGAVLQDCRLDGARAAVTVVVTPQGRLGRLGAARARAVAGPA